MKKSIGIVLVISIFFIVTIQLFAGEYRPEISGDYEIGNKTYIDVFELEDEGITEDEQLIDSYLYKKIWLRFKQKLDKSDYYYIKVQYNNKDYQEKINYNSTALDLWTNYTFKINKQLKNKVMLDYRNKRYDNKTDNTYNQIRLKYQLDHQINEENDCTLYLQRQWKDYPAGDDKDNVYDRISLSWDRDINDNLTISSKVQFDQTKFNPVSESTDKNGRKFNIGFKWKL